MRSSVRPPVRRPARTLVRRSARPARPGVRAAASLRALPAACALALCALLAPSRASAQGARGVYAVGVMVIRPSWIERPLVTERGHVDLHGGVAFAHYRYARFDPTVGAHLEVMAGVHEVIEVGGGVGLRFSREAAQTSADRFARVNREWIPTGLALGALDPFTNPYLRARVAFVNRGSVLVGGEVFHNLPVAAGTCFGIGVGVPIHIIAGTRVRFETGVFHEFDTSCQPFPGSAVRDSSHYVQIPLRVNFQVTPILWLGLRTGIEAVNWRFDRVTDTYAPLGFQGGVRVTPRVDITWQIVFPEFFHYDAALGDHVLFRAYGGGVGVVARVL